MTHRLLIPCLLVLLSLFATASPAAPEAVAEKFLRAMIAGPFDATQHPLDQAMKSEWAKGTFAPVVKDLAGATITSPAKVGKLGGYTTVEFQILMTGKPFTARVALDRREQIAGFFFLPPQTPDPAPSAADPWTEAQVTVGSAPWQTPGVLALPRQGTGLPAVVILGGSGPTDADGTLGANKPYRDLARGLAAHGVAVLRFDKRSLAHGAQMMTAKRMTLDEEYVDDALAAITLLRAHPRIDGKRVFVLGHSQGALALPRVAKRDAAVAGLIYAAAGTDDMLGTMVRQLDYLGSHKQGGLGPEELALRTAAADGAKQLSALPTGATDGPAIMGIPAAYWLDLRDHPAMPATAALPQPLLFLQGGRDYQVTPDDARKWKTVLDAAGKSATWKFHPKLNHLFIEGEGASLPEEYAKQGKVSDAVISDIAEFVTGKR